MAKTLKLDLSCVWPIFFFHFFQKRFFLHFCIFWLTKWMCMVLVLIFSKFDMYLPYKNRFWGLFSWFCCQGTNSNVWTRSGSKVDFKVVVSKGLKHFFLITFRDFHFFWVPNISVDEFRMFYFVQNVFLVVSEGAKSLKKLTLFGKCFWMEFWWRAQHDE